MTTYPDHVTAELNLGSVESEKDLLAILLDSTRDDSAVLVKEIDLQPELRYHRTDAVGQDVQRTAYDVS